MKQRFTVALLCLSAAWLTAQNSPQSGSSQSDNKLPEIHSFDLNSMDRSANPCDDFFQFACGNWVKNNPIPPDQGRWGSFSLLAERNRMIVRNILEKASANDPKRDPVHQKIGDFYQACMDEFGINQKGISPLKPELTRIDAIKDKQSLIDEIAHLQNQGLRAPFGFGAGSDLHNADMIIAQFGEGGTALPDRDYYLAQDEKSKDTRDKYLTHVTNMLKLAGDNNADADAKKVMDIETQLAKAQLDRVARRDPKNRDHKTTLDELAAANPNLELKRFVGERNAPSFETLNVGAPDFLKTVNGMMDSVPLDDWKVYLRWHLLHGTATELSDDFVKENFTFYGQYLGGQKELPARWKRCVAATDRALGEAVGQPYVAETFTPADKARTLKMVDNIENALKQDIQGLDWMSDETKKQALVKLEAIRNKIGYPAHWRDYSTVKIVRGDYFGNIERADAFEVQRNLKKIGKPLDRTEFGMTPPTVNAYYSPPNNDINFPAGILQPPFFDTRVGDEVNYGGIGAVIGHELTHGFDDQGSKFDAHGNLSNWWTQKDKDEFEQRVGCIADEYSGFEPLPGLHVNGRLTLGENTADNGGVRIAMRAYHNSAAAGSNGGSQEAQGKDANGFTPEQRFFIGYAQVWCENQTDQALRLQVLTNPHSPGRYRVNGVMQNSDDFAKAFSCHSGQKMVSEHACHVW